MRSLILLVTVLSFVLIGCSGYRVVKLTEGGGEVALFGDRLEAMTKANQEMAMHCGGHGKFKIVEQGEVVVGSVAQTTSSSRGKAKPTHGGGLVTSQRGRETTTTRDKTEWRVKFECKGDESGRVHTVRVAI